MKQNITLAVDKLLLKRARVFAAERGCSISALLADELNKIVERESAFDRDRRKALSFLDQPLHLGGERRPSREDLHDRKNLR